MTEFLLKNLALILFLGFAAQWLAWRFRLPSLLLLLLFGFIAGPVLGLISPDALFGELLSPLVAISVAIILFEEGLSFTFAEISRVGGVVRNLVTLGTILSWLLTTVASIYFLELSLPLSLLLGAVLSMSGPTVINPLLRDSPLRGQLGAIIRSEGVAVEPVAVTLGVLVLGAIFSAEIQGSSAFAVIGVGKTAIIGLLGGLLGAVILIWLNRSAALPDYLKNPAVLSIVVGVFTVSNLLQPGAGLLAAIVLGMFLANQSLVSVSPFVEFKENLRVLALSTLLIVLAARLDTSLLREFNLGGLCFIASLVFVIRPVAVIASTIGSSLHWNERLFLSGLAPRGFLTLALSSLFALDLLDIGYPQGERIVTLSFFVVIATVAVYGLGAPLLARLLKVADENPHGILFLGAHDWARAIGREVSAVGYRVLFVDSNHYNVLAARREELPARVGNIFVDHTIDDFVLDGIGRFFALTSNDEVNTLAALHFSDILGKDRVFQLAQPGGDAAKGLERFQANILFGKGLTYGELEERFTHGFVVRTLMLDADLSIELIQSELGSEVLPLFVVAKTGELQPVVVERPPVVLSGCRLICAMDARTTIPEGGKLIPFDRRR